MKLAIIRKRYTPYGGAERFISQLVAPLSEKGLDITVIADAWSGQPVAGIQWLRAKATGLTRLGREISFHRSVKRVLSGNSFDLVQSHERFVGADICRLGDGLHKAWLDRYQSTLAACRRWAVAVDPFHRKILSLESAMVAHPATHLVANSALIRDELQHYYGVLDSRITVIPNGVDTNHFQPASSKQILESRAELGIPRDTFVVSAVGSGFQRKGFFELVQAMAALSNIFLLVAGKDKAANRLKKLIDRLGLSQRVKLLGPVQEVRKVYWASDIFALPSLYDPSSNAVLEALACGLPVVTTHDVGTAKEIVREAAGIICYRAADSIAGAILDCKEKRARYASNARNLALTFSQEKIVEHWLALYERALASRESRVNSAARGTLL